MKLIDAPAVRPAPVTGAGVAKLSVVVPGAMFVSWIVEPPLCSVSECSVCVVPALLPSSRNIPPARTRSAETGRREMFVVVLSSCSVVSGSTVIDDDASEPLPESWSVPWRRSMGAVCAAG